MKNVLVVDDEKLIRWSLGSKLTSWGYSVVTAEDVKSAGERLDERLPDLVLLDIKLPDGSGIDVLQRIRDTSADIAVIMITAEGTVETAVQAMKLGAYDYISKPFNLSEMQVIIEKALEKTELRKKLDFYEADIKAVFARERMIGNSQRFAEVLTLIEKVAVSPVGTVLVLGESGTGKNLAAKAIHAQSDRADQPYVTIECTTIPENLLESELFGHEKGAYTDAHTAKKGLFELANGGTVFIDEIGDLPLAMQAKLLRIIEERKFKRLGGLVDIDAEVRVIAATNMDLGKAVEAKQFRKDLYYRLNIVPVYLPPLRERDQDAVILAEHFMREFNRQFGKGFDTLSPEARELLLRYSWPGNVRELRNAIERAVLLESGDTIEEEHLWLKESLAPESSQGPAFMTPANGSLTMDQMEAEMINRALETAGGNQTQAARALGVTRDVLRYRMKKYGIHN
jgi:DNA-binding NtrC family response regulator